MTMRGIRSMLKACKQIVSKLFNILTPKRKNRIYARYMFNSYSDNYDVCNSGSSNLLTLIKELANTPQEKPVEVFIEYYDGSRKAVYDRFAKDAERSGVKVIFYENWRMKKSVLKKVWTRFLCMIERFRCVIWLTESGDDHLYGKLRCQKSICCNYFISCKSDFVPGLERRWAKLDGLFTTNLLPSNMIASHMGTRLDHCIQIGFPRNDTLIKNDRRQAVLNWVRGQVDYTPKHIFVYAPTVRDEDDTDQKITARPLLGYPSEDLSDFLVQRKAVVIYKLHPYQNSAALKGQSGLIEYPKSYDFSFYDLLSVSDCMIGDYSSINYDYLMTDHPIIFNLYDLDKFVANRGLSYDPYEAFCPGEIVKNWEEMKKAMESVIEGNDTHQKDRAYIRKLMFKYKDASAGKRAVEFVISQLSH